MHESGDDDDDDDGGGPPCTTGPRKRAVCAERKWMGVSLGRTFLSQWGRGGGGSSRVGMLPAHYWTEMLQLGGAMQNRHFCLTAFSRGSRKARDVLLVVAHTHPTLGQKWAEATTTTTTNKKDVHSCGFPDPGLKSSTIDCPIRLRRRTRRPAETSRSQQTERNKKINKK